MPSVNNTSTYNPGLLSPIVPAGVITAFAGLTLPSGWLLCDGSTISRVSYQNLFSAIGVIYGLGNQTSTFTLPDYRGRFLRMIDGTLGLDVEKAQRLGVVSGSRVISITTVLNSYTVTVSDTSNLIVGLVFSSIKFYNSGLGLTPSATISAILSPTTFSVTCTNAATAAGTDSTVSMPYSLSGNLISTTQSDALQGHFHQGRFDSSGSGTTYTPNFNQTTNTGYGVRTTSISISANEFLTDPAYGSTNTPRAGYETRPKNSNVNYIIKY